MTSHPAFWQMLLFTTSPIHWSIFTLYTHNWCSSYVVGGVPTTGFVFTASHFSLAALVLNDETHVWTAASTLPAISIMPIISQFHHSYPFNFSVIIYSSIVPYRILLTSLPLLIFAPRPLLLPLSTPSFTVFPTILHLLYHCHPLNPLQSILMLLSYLPSLHVLMHQSHFF